MADPEIADTKPAVAELAPGVYFWCACGRSAAQPFCDGTHKGTEFRPVRFEISEVRTVALCRCKRTSSKPFCDGTHRRLQVDPAGG
jgi:CDGSH iron-sulfur domain-containing protein 3